MGPGDHEHLSPERQQSFPDLSETRHSRYGGTAWEIDPTPRCSSADGAPPGRSRTGWNDPRLDPIRFGSALVQAALRCLRTEHSMIQRRHALQWIPVLALMTGCSTLMGQRDPVQVQLVGLEPLKGEGLELRFLCKLRVQNPNEAPIEFNGIYLALEVRGSAFATGVSNAIGTVPRFGEVVLSIPITVSALQLARQAIGIYQSGDRNRIDYVLKGTIGGSAFGSVRFESRGELTLPRVAAEAGS